MREWTKTARTILATTAVVSTGWLIAGAVFLQNYRPSALPAPVSASVPADPAMKEQGRTLRVEAAMAPLPGRLLVPVQGVARNQLVDTFTQSRSGGTRVHNAIDIMAARGTPVFAAASGTVEKLFVSKLGGNTVYIRAPDRRMIYYYAHLDSYAPQLAEKQEVKAGTFIGRVGSTGDASPDAPHLHFATMTAEPGEGWWQGTPINPYPLLIR
ncbi:M23 family metallopeptidase [Novosphingobium tardum]|uniref:M23 family metallopeptidase n=1 Tax=Novosphingobium tardum TaxID=1538021 RepID=A0ABV8RPW7_9SPHN